MTLASLCNVIETAVRQLFTQAEGDWLPQYKDDPLGYAEYIGVILTEDQKSVALALLEPPYKVIIASGHNIGKSFLLAFLVNWWFDTRPQSSIAISTAPTQKHTEDILWSAIRLQRRRAGLPDHFIGPAAPSMRADVDHYAQGMTASKGEAFQGRHPIHFLQLMDEATGLHPIYFTTGKGMFQPDGNHAWVCALNPTDTSSQVYQEAQRGGWRVIHLSSLDHPNIAAELAGQPAPYPGAVSVAQVRQWLADWFDEIPASEFDPARDVQFPDPDGTIRCYRPGPLGECRALGRWPTQAVNSVWSQGLWQAVCSQRHEMRPDWPVTIGADLARFGDDRSVFCVRKGTCIMHIEAHNGWDTRRSAQRLRELCHQFAGNGSREQAHNDPKNIPVYIDEGAMGAGVVDHHENYSFVGVSSGRRSLNEGEYPNVRSQLWFDAVKIAKQGAIDLSRLPHAVREELGRELMAPTYTVDSVGRRVVEPKDVTKKRLRRSPDIADSFHLSLWLEGGVTERIAGHIS